MAAGLLALIAGTRLHAEEPPAPRIYPTSETYLVEPGPDRATIARQKKLFARDLARCDAGELAVCTALGVAFRTGEGQPQNRPVAELLFRQACDGGEPQGCRELAALLRVADGNEDTREQVSILARACDLGALAACADYAAMIEEGVGQLGNLAAADDIRRAACAQESEASCLALAQSLTGTNRNLARRTEGRAVIARLCEWSDAETCERAKQLLGPIWRPSTAELRAYLLSACDQGDAEACDQWGHEELLMRDGSDDAAATTRALGLFDRACATLEEACEKAAGLREEAVLDRECASGKREACRAFADRYDDFRWGPDAARKARAIMASLCETAGDDAERGTTCMLAARKHIYGKKMDEPSDPAQIEALLTLGCEAGEFEACLDLISALFDGKLLPQDRPRAYAMLGTDCAAGVRRACNWMENFLARDPAAPLLDAGGEFAPANLSEEDAAGHAPAKPAPNDTECRTTTVNLRGVEYTDTFCPRFVTVTAGSAVEKGAAPWQALIWRPDRVGTTRIPPNFRVLCGGTVIRTGWVLTAAHCLIDMEQDIRTAGHRLRLGVSNPNGPEGFSYKILETHAHSKYTGKQPYYWDIALIRYDPASGVRSGPAFAPKTVAADPKPFAARRIMPATPAVVYGWGRTAVNPGPIPTSLLSGRVLLRTPEACQTALNFPPETRDTMLCADRANSQQACNGDSGGPVIVFEPGARGPRTPVLVGVISSGKACGTKGKPSRFTRVAHPEVQSWMGSVLAGSSPPKKAR
jgi:TPR repeat protein